MAAPLLEHRRGARARAARRGAARDRGRPRRRGARTRARRGACAPRTTCPGSRNSAMDGFAVRSGPAGRDLRRRRRVARRAPGATSRSATARRSGSRPARCCPTAPTPCCSRSSSRTAASAITLLDEVAPGRNVREAGEDLRAGDARARRRARGSGPATLGVAVNAGRASLRCARAPARRRARDRRRAAARRRAARARPGPRLQPRHARRRSRSATAREVVLARDVPDNAGATRDGDRRGARGGRRRDPLRRRLGRPARSRQARARRRSASRSASGASRCGPGKPTWFGVRGGTLVFGLPGNPVSAMVTFLLFARPGARRAAVGRAAGRRPRGARRARSAVTPIATSACACGSRTAGPSRPARRARTCCARWRSPTALVVIPRGEGRALAAGTEVELIAV